MWPFNPLGQAAECLLHYRNAILWTTSEVHQEDQRMLTLQLLQLRLWGWTKGKICRSCCSVSKPSTTGFILTFIRHRQIPWGNTWSTFTQQLGSWKISRIALSTNVEIHLVLYESEVYLNFFLDQFGRLNMKYDGSINSFLTLFFHRIISKFKLTWISYIIITWSDTSC